MEKVSFEELEEFVWCYEHSHQSKTLVKRIVRLANKLGLADKIDDFFDVLGFSSAYARKQGWIA